MKVCMITFQYPPMFNGGVGTVAFRLARNLASAGLEMHVVAPGTHGLDERPVPTIEDGVAVHRTLPALGKYFGEHTQLGWIGDYVKTLHRKIDFDLIHSLFLVPAGQVGAIVAGEIHRPLVASIHGSDIELMRYNPVFSGTLRWVLTRADVVTAVSVDLMGKAEQFAEIETGRVIANAFDPESFDRRSVNEVAADQGWRFQVFVESFLRAKRRGRLVVGTAGIVRPAKGFHFLLEAFHKLVETFPNAHLLIVGDFVNPEVRKRYCSKIKKMGLRRKVSLTGPVPLQHVTAWMREMDIFAFPSLHEGSPNALMEAMACGLAVVASDVGGIPELVEDGRNGLLVRPGDSETLAENLIALCQEPELRMRLGDEAKRDAQSRFSPVLETETWLDVYRTVNTVAPKSTGMLQMGPQ